MDARGNGYVILTSAVKRGQYEVAADRPPGALPERGQIEDYDILGSQALPEPLGVPRVSPVMRRIAVLAASAALVFAACGGDEEEPAATPAATEAAMESPHQAPTEAATEAAAGGAKLAIAADPGGANAFTETELTADAGPVEIDFANESSKAARRRDRGRRRRGDRDGHRQ